MKACPDSIFGSGLRAMEEEVSKKVDAYIAMLQQSAEMCEDGGVMLPLTPHHPPFLSRTPLFLQGFLYLDDDFVQERKKKEIFKKILDNFF